MRVSYTALLLSGVCAAVASSANAQTTGPAAPAAAADQVSEVIVTSQRRSERLQDVPVAVSVVSSQALANANYTGLTDLQHLVPSLQYNANTGGGFQVRGVGTQSLNLSTEQDVGVVIDDVIQGIPQLTFAPPSYQALTDIDRIEVLKGPQGTLFGKNSSVGVLQIVTKRPELGVFSEDAEVSAASHGEYKIQASINAPYGDTLALRLSAFELHHDGFVKNVYNGDELGGYDQYGLRGKLLWKPINDLSIYVIADKIRTSSPGNGAWTLRSCGSGFGNANPCQTDAAYGIVAGPNNRQVAEDATSPARTDSTDLSLHIDYTLGNLTFTSISAFIDLHQYENIDVDNSPRSVLDIDASAIESHQYTQEFRISSATKQFLSYTVGAYYYKTLSDYHQELAGAFTFLPDNSTTLLSNGFAGTASGGQTVLRSASESYALFGQGTLHLTDKLQLIGGLRYTHDNVDASVFAQQLPNVCEFSFAFGAPCHSITLPSPPENASGDSSNVSGKVTLKYDFTPRINAYVTYATGYKGPAVSYAALTPLSVIKPETSNAYEVGVKSELFERHVVLNADLFYEKYTNFQADTFVLNAINPAASNFELANAGGLETKGFEADATWRATQELTVTGSISYAPTKFTDFVIQCQNQFTNPSTTGTCSTIAGNAVFNAKGYPLPQAPETSYNIEADWQHPLGNGFLIDASTNWNWRSSTYTVVADRNTIQGGYGLLGANIGFGPQSSRWRVSVFARNLLDQKFVSAIFPTFLDNGSATGIALPTIGYSNVPSLEAERTVGVKLSAKW